MAEIVITESLDYQAHFQKNSGKIPLLALPLTTKSEGLIKGLYTDGDWDILPNEKRNKSFSCRSNDGHPISHFWWKMNGKEGINLTVAPDTACQFGVYLPSEVYVKAIKSDDVIMDTTGCPKLKIKGTLVDIKENTLTNEKGEKDCKVLFGYSMVTLLGGFKLPPVTQTPYQGIPFSWPMMLTPFDEESADKVHYHHKGDCVKINAGPHVLERFVSRDNEGIYTSSRFALQGGMSQILLSACNDSQTMPHFGLCAETTEEMTKFLYEEGMLTNKNLFTVLKYETEADEGEEDTKKRKEKEKKRKDDDDADMFRLNEEGKKRSVEEGQKMKKESEEDEARMKAHKEIMGRIGISKEETEKEDEFQKIIVEIREKRKREKEEVERTVENEMKKVQGRIKKREIEGKLEKVKIFWIQVSVDGVSHKLTCQKNRAFGPVNRTGLPTMILFNWRPPLKLFVEGSQCHELSLFTMDAAFGTLVCEAVDGAKFGGIVERLGLV